MQKVLGLAELDRSRPALTIERFDDALASVARDLIDTMRASPGCVGLAAPQIGVGLRIFVVDVTDHPKTTTCHGRLVLCNPKLVLAEDKQLAREGCMSVPDLTGDVARAGRIVVVGLDQAGEKRRIETDAFEARAIQHEIDHLDGLVFLDRLAGPRALHVRRIYR